MQSSCELFAIASSTWKQDLVIVTEGAHSHILSFSLFCVHRWPLRLHARGLETDEHWKRRGTFLLLSIGAPSFEHRAEPSDKLGSEGVLSARHRTGSGGAGVSRHRRVGIKKRQLKRR